METRKRMREERMEGDGQKQSRDGDVGRYLHFHLLWFDKEECYEHVTLLASITLLAWAVLIGGDLSAQSLSTNAERIFNFYTSSSSLHMIILVLCNT